MLQNGYSLLDRFLIELQHSVLRNNPTQRFASEAVVEQPLSSADQQLSASLMRINHTGEVCAQALYLGQAVVARDEKTRTHLLDAAKEEAQHLDWCQQRLQELNSHTSVLNLAFFSLSIMTGMLAGLASDKISLGFIAETEKQVAAHLASHLERLPADDHKSRAIVARMHSDEIKHQEEALNAGGEELPLMVQWLMRLSSQVMTRTTYYI